MSSRIASIVQLIQANFTSPALKGISPAPLPESALYPYITVNEVFGKKLESLTGPSGLRRVLVQVNCWSPDYEAADTLREAVGALINTFSGTAGGKVIQGANHVLDAELYNADRKVHQCISRYGVWFEV